MSRNLPLLHSDWIFRRWYFDMYLLIPTAILISLGFVMVSSASFSYAEQRFGSELFFVKRHGVYVLFGIATMFMSFFVPSTWWSKYSGLLIFSSIFLLCLVLIPGFGVSLNGSRRWLALGGWTMQVSELVKLATIFFVSAYLARYRRLMADDWRTWAVLLGIMGIINALLIKEPDYGSVVVISGIFLALLFLGGIRLRIFVSIMMLAIAGLLALILFSQYRLDRITAFANPWADPHDNGYQLIQSLIALGRGEWLGVGLGQSIQKMEFLPDGYTDFIFAIYAEEFGFVGTILMLLIFAILVGRIFQLSSRAMELKNWFATYVCVGIGLLISGQTFINVGVNSGLLPTKGLTLPFVSYGGTSLICCCAAIGILMRVSHDLHRATKNTGRYHYAG